MSGRMGMTGIRAFTDVVSVSMVVSVRLTTRMGIMLKRSVRVRVMFGISRIGDLALEFRVRVRTR